MPPLAPFSAPEPSLHLHTRPFSFTLAARSTHILGTVFDADHSTMCHFISADGESAMRHGHWLTAACGMYSAQRAFLEGALIAEPRIVEVAHV
jgi:hypothetical protein